MARVLELGPIGADLHEGWQLRAAGDERWRAVAVPAPWQALLGAAFAGRGEYRLRFRRLDTQPVRIAFEAVATVAVVYVNGHPAGNHVGAWTPFSVDCTPFLDPAPDAVQELVVAVDQAPGHLTAGFLPVIGGAFGGIWGAVTRVGETGRRVAIAAPAEAELQARGDALWCDDRRVTLRGILHWGLYPELGVPRPSRATIDAELDMLLGLGFNAVKMCLWVPPLAYLEACQQRGVLVWQEYPVWDRAVDDAALLEEIEEMVRRDAPFSCVVGRSLTCENPRLDDTVAAAFVDLVKRLAPHGLALPNSAFIGMEASGDVWDEHPYLHLRQWLRYPGRLAAALVGREPRPVVFGETMAIDTWRGPPPPWPGGAALVAPARAAAVGTRRDQIELVREVLPHASYFVNAMRDIPSSPLGFCDAAGAPKFDARSFDWHGPVMVLCGLTDRSVVSGGELGVRWSVSNFAAGAVGGELSWSFGEHGGRCAVAAEPGCVTVAGSVSVAAPQSDSPRPVALRAELGSVRVGWQVWVVPAAGRGSPTVELVRPLPGSLAVTAHHFWSPIPWLDPGLDGAGGALIRDLLQRDLLSGWALRPRRGLRPLVQVVDVHDRGDRPLRIPLVAVARVDGTVRVWSALRHSSPAGQWLAEWWCEVAATLPADGVPELGSDPMGAAIELRQWTPVGAAAGDASAVECGHGVDLEGVARFSHQLRLPDDWPPEVELFVEAVGDGYRLSVDGVVRGQAGNMDAAWDGCRFAQQRHRLRLAPGRRHCVELEVREWIGAGAMLGPVWVLPAPDRAELSCNAGAGSDGHG